MGSRRSRNAFHRLLRLSLPIGQRHRCSSRYINSDPGTTCVQMTPPALIDVSIGQPLRLTAPGRRALRRASRSFIRRRSARDRALADSRSPRFGSAPATPGSIVARIAVAPPRGQFDVQYSWIPLFGRRPMPSTLLLISELIAEIGGSQRESELYFSKARYIDTACRPYLSAVGPLPSYRTDVVERRMTDGRAVTIRFTTRVLRSLDDYKP